MNPIRSKIVAKLSDEGVDKLEAWLNATSPVERKAIVSTMTDEEVDLVDMYKKSLDRDKEIASMEKAADKEAVESSPIAGRIKAYGEGVAATVPLMQELGTAARSAFSDNSYYQQKKEDEQLRAALKEAYPGAFYGGAGVGVATQVLAPFGVAGKVIPKTGALSLGKAGQVAQKIVAGPGALSKNKWIQAGTIPLVGAGYGLLANPEGVSSLDEELKARLQGAKTGAAVASGIAAGIPVIAGTLNLGQQLAGKVLRGIPMSVSKRIQQNPALLNEASEIAPRFIVEDVVNKVQEKRTSIGKAIESTLQEAQDAGIKVNVESVAKMIDDDIAKIYQENAGKDISDLAQAKIDFLEQFKKDLLHPKDLVEARMDIPAQIEEQWGSKIEHQAVDPEHQPYERGKRMMDWLEKDFNVSLRRRLPKGADRAYIERLGQLKGQRLKEAMKQWFGVNVPEERLAELQGIIDTQPIRVPVGQQIGYEAQTVRVPKGTEGSYNVNIPQEPYKEMAPIFSQTQKLRVKREYRAFPKSGGSVDDVEGYLAEMGNRQREAIPELGVPSTGNPAVDKTLREKSNLPFDAWANLKTKQVPTITKKLVGKANISDVATEEEAVKLVKNLVENKGNVQKDLVEVVGEKNAKELLDFAQDSYAQMAVSSDVHPYFRNRALWSVVNGVKNLLVGGGAFFAGGVPAVSAIVAGSALSSNAGYRALPVANKLLRSGARNKTVAAYLSGKLNEGE